MSGEPDVDVKPCRDLVNPVGPADPRIYTVIRLISPRQSMANWRAPLFHTIRLCRQSSPPPQHAHPAQAPPTVFPSIAGRAVKIASLSSYGHLRPPDLLPRPHTTANLSPYVPLRSASTTSHGATSLIHPPAQTRLQSITQAKPVHSTASWSCKMWIRRHLLKPPGIMERLAQVVR
jgi:hypothetical protein